MKVYCWILCLFLVGCTSDNRESDFQLSFIFNTSTFIDGKEAYLNSPFVTAGDRVYMVGQQDGSFKELGWHIPDEMGGVWAHPIKLLDGFQLRISNGDETLSLDNASQFRNYPFGSRQLFSLESLDITVERFQFVPQDFEGLVVQYVFKNTSNKNQHFNLRFIADVDLRPTWLGDETGLVDTPDVANFEKTTGQWVAKDRKNPWFVTYGSTYEAIGNAKYSAKYKGKGLRTVTDYNMEIPKNNEESITFFVASSLVSREDATKKFNQLKDDYPRFLQAKKARYVGLGTKSKLTIPDKKLQEAFEWLKYNCDWLVQEVPGLGKGMTAGIPDYPWFFGVDSEYALKGYAAIGQFETVKSTIKLIDSISKVANDNGRIIHEMSTNGAVFNKGNVNETPQFVSLIWEVYKWIGDESFLENYYPTILTGMEWIQNEKDKNQNLFPDGFGMMEIHGLDSEMIDVACYTQRAYEDTSKIALELGDSLNANKYRNLSEQLKTAINNEFWSEEDGSFADFIGTDIQALKLVDDALVRADTLNKPWSVEELKLLKEKIITTTSSDPSPFVLHHNWVVNTPMEMGIADSTKAITALNTATQYSNPFGMFVTGIDRDETAGTEISSFKGSEIFSYTGAVMTLPTGVQVIAENNYGRTDKALEYLKRMTNSFSFALPGSMYEVSPDYGMITQAWNIYGYAIPIVQQFFGIQPMASKKTITIQPKMPQEWDVASLENVQVGNNEISIYYKRVENKLELQVLEADHDWTLKILLPKGSDYESFDEVEVKTMGDNILFTSHLPETRIIVYYD
ncbi:alpha-L-rhamnosidase-related protein [Aegicerativicinus sediminis]|uniref:alpha-L-rhamnosidase-related protein n=1 Tax=Aegicerativicinus sediminis TaxID=2893202 RepID=UPI001E53A605|nr:glycogen debranching protein [Aegicerativicinus sediminis]